MAFRVVYDACVLHDSVLRPFLAELARERSLHLRAFWTESILEETARSIAERTGHPIRADCHLVFGRSLRTPQRGRHVQTMRTGN